MRLPKIIALMMTGILAFNICTINAWAVAEKVTFGVMSAETVGGNTTVTVPVQSVISPINLCLIAAYFDENGKILSINSSMNAIDTVGDTLEVTLTDKSSEGGTLRYFIWDSLSGQIPFRNGAPASPGSVEVTGKTRASATLSWGAAEDDYNSVETYNIYDEGILIAEGIGSTQKTVNNLLWGTQYSLEVKAVDEEGAESLYGTEAVFETESIMTSVTEGVSIQNSPDLNFQGKLGNNYWLGTYIETSAAGLDCVANTKRVYNSTPTYLCFAFTPEMLTELGNERDFVLELTYFDDNTNYIMLEYKYFDATGAETTERLTGPRKTGTGTWKVARMNVTLAGAPTASTAKNDGAYTFRFCENTDGGTRNEIGNIDGYDIGLRVHRFSAMPKSEYSPKNAYFKADKVNFTCNMNAQAQQLTLETIEGRDAVKTSQFDFTVTDTAVTGGADAYVELNYFAPEQNTSITLGGETVTANPGKWQKVRFNPANVGTGSIVANSDIYIHSVYVVSE